MSQSLAEKARELLGSSDWEANLECIASALAISHEQLDQPLVEAIAHLAIASFNAGEYRLAKRVEEAIQGAGREEPR